MDADMMQKLLEMKRQAYKKVRQPVVSENIIHKEIMLPMRDGVLLRTLLWAPEKYDKLPVVLVRSCYPDSVESLRIDGEEFARRGFGYVVQWCRGTGGSDGVWEPNVNERSDGQDTINIIASQSFVNCIGYYGNSYLALTGWCIADSLPEKVKSMYLGVYGTHRHISAYKDGMFRQDILTAWAMGNAGAPINADYLESCRYMPQIDVDKSLWGVDLPWYRDWITSADETDEYWQQGFWKQLSEIPGRVKVPLLIKEGWYDHHLGSAVASYSALSQEAKKNSVFRIGPWNHSFMSAIEWLDPAFFEYEEISQPLNWFEDTLIKKIKPEGCVQKYIIGANQWKTSKSMEGGKGRRAIYLSMDNDGNKSLTDSVPYENAFTTYEYDPENPLMSHGAESLFATFAGVGSKIQPDTDWRSDVVSFVSAELDDPLEIDGKINVRLFVSSTAEDSAFTAKLMEVFPDGRAVNIRGSISSLAYRNKKGVREEYCPEGIAEINIDMWDICWKTQKNSRLRLDISSSDFPQYNIHSNYKGIWALQKKTKKAQQRIYWGENTPSCIILPLAEEN